MQSLFYSLSAAGIATRCSATVGIIIFAAAKQYKCKGNPQPRLITVFASKQIHKLHSPFSFDTTYYAPRRYFVLFIS